MTRCQSADRRDSCLKHNFILRGFFDRRGYFNPDQMTPAAYRSRKFLKGRSDERIWLSGNELFTAGPGDKAELSQEGQRQIDDAMTALVSYLPNSPIVVEGYATQGSSSERFIRGQERAVAVQLYISKRFGLHPNTVGAMPMTNPVPPSVGKSVWDGVYHSSWFTDGQRHELRVVEGTAVGDESDLPEQTLGCVAKTRRRQAGTHLRTARARKV